MAHTLARTLFFLALAGLASGLVGPASHPLSVAQDAPAPPDTARVVVVAGALLPEDLVALSSAVAAARPPAVLLIDSPRSTDAHRSFLAEFQADQVVPVGEFPDGLLELERRLGVRVKPRVEWVPGVPPELRRLLLPAADTVVVCPAEPRGRLLHAAALAGAEQAPLFVLRDDKDAAAARDWVGRSLARSVVAVGNTARLLGDLPGVTVTPLASESAVAAAHRRRLKGEGTVRRVVVANPEDYKQDRGTMSLLAPWLAVLRQAPLALTNKYGDDAEDAVNAVLADGRLRHVDTLILAATLKAIPPGRRPNPIPEGKDPFIECEPFTPRGLEPYTFSVGRLFHDDLAVVPAMVARQQLLLAAGNGKPLKALVASNSGGGLPLLEAFSRNTVQELKNVGFETTARFGGQVGRDELRKLLPEHHLFLWEGHHNTLIRDWQFPDWTEPLPPSLMFLQSCLALHEWKALPLLQRGAVAVVGSSTRIYSGSGGACSLAFFDALGYDDRPLGDALRQAKNFLVCYAQLKDKRLGKESKGEATTLRSTWAFTLWGDPTFKLPRPSPPADALPAVSHRVQGNSIIMDLPAAALGKVHTASYFAQMMPNGRLAGLLRDGHADDGKQMVALAFAEVPLTCGPEGKVPVLSSKVPSNCWVFTWDARRRTGYLLVAPRAKDESMRFQITWRDPPTDPVTCAE